MIITIKEAVKLSNKFLKLNGFSDAEAKLATENLLEAQISGKESHGFRRLIWFEKLISSGRVKPSKKEVSVKKNTSSSLLVDGHMKPGGYVMRRTVDMAIKKAKKSGIVVGGTTNMAPSHGFIGHYARLATEKNLIYLGFHSSDSLTIPHGASEPVWGTNPFTVGIPSSGRPIILDMASTKTTYGSVMVAGQKGEEIEEGLILDKKGNSTINPLDAIDGGFLPFAGHKGSGLAFIIELMAGVLTDSKAGNFKKGGWGGLFILIKPDLIRPLDDFKKDVSKAIRDLKTSRKMKGVKEIFYPGEISQLMREKTLKSGKVDIGKDLYEFIVNFIKSKE